MSRRRSRESRTAPREAPPRPAWAGFLGPLLERPWFAPALFALVAMAYFWPVPFSGDVIYGQDVGTDFHKGTASVVEKLRDLVPSAWDPRMGGYPISDEIRHKYFPTYLIELFTTHQRAIGWRYLLAVFGAGWGMSLYLRQLGVSRAVALWGGLAFLSAPTFLTFTYAGQYAKMTVIALFPFLCLCLERGMDGGRRALGWWVLMAVLIALGVFSPHLQMLQYALLGIGLYFVYKVVALRRAGATAATLAGRAGLFAAATALGLGLAAEGVLPAYLHVKTESKRAAIQDEAGRSAQEQLALAQSWSLHPEEIASLVVPEFVGFHDPRNQQNHYWGRNPMKLNSEYFGILVLLLALLAAARARRDPLVLFLCLLFAVAVAYTLGPHTPVHGLAYHFLPGAKVLRAIGMAAFLFAFPAVVLAALGLHRLLDGEPEARAQAAQRLLVLGGSLTAVALLIAVAPGAAVSGWALVLWPDIPAQQQQAMAASAPWVARGALLVALVVAAGTALLTLAARGRLGAVPLVLGLAALTVADTWRIDRLFLHLEDPARWPDYRHTNPRTIDFLAQQPGKFRLFPVPDYGFLSEPRYHLHGADVVTAFNNYTLRRYDRLLGQFQEQLYRASQGLGPEGPSDEQLLAAIHPLLDLVNARYLVTKAQVQLRAEAYPEAFSGEGVRLYENPTALPWFRLVSAVEVLDGERAVLAAVRDGAVDLATTAILEQPAPLALPGAQADRTGDRVIPEVYDYREGRVRVRVQATGPRLLVVSDNYHPHWRAAVDGQSAPVLRADYVWKAVPVPGGDHLVELTYHSAPVAIARAISAACALAVLAYLAMRWRRRPSTVAADASP